MYHSFYLEAGWPSGYSIQVNGGPEGWWFKPWVFQAYFSFLFINFFSFRYPRFKFSSFQPKKELKNCSFNFIISMFLWMYLSYRIRNRSQKFWDIYQDYLLTFEQDEMEFLERTSKWKRNIFMILLNSLLTIYLNKKLFISFQ